MFYRLGKTVVEVLAAIGRTAVGSFGDIEMSGLKTIATLSAAFLALKSGPVGMFLLLLGAILLLLEDFMVWQKGGKSLFDWTIVNDKLQDMGDKLGDIPDKVSDITQKVDDLFGKIQAGQFIMAIVETFLDTVETGLDGINVALDLLDGLIDILLGDFEDLKDNPLLDDLKEFVNDFANIGGGWRQQTGNKIDNYIDSKVSGIPGLADTLNDWTWSVLNKFTNFVGTLKGWNSPASDESSNFADVLKGWTWPASNERSKPADILKDWYLPALNEQSKLAGTLNDWTWSALNALGIGNNRAASKIENNTTNTQNNNVTNNFYGTTTDEQVSKIGGSIQRFRMWTPKT